MLAPPQTALTIRGLRDEDQGRVSVTDERRHRQKDLPFCLSVCAPGPLLAMPWRAEDMAAKVTASFRGRKFAWSTPRLLSVSMDAHPRQAEPRITLQKLLRVKCGSLSASTSALTLPKVVCGFGLMPS